MSVNITRFSIFCGLAACLLAQPAYAQTPLSEDIADDAAAPARQVIVQDVPASDDFYRVAADRTPSGLAVPRFVSLKYGEVNGRQGPSTTHNVLWQYRRKGLPLIVVAETKDWRKVRDNQGDEAWVRRVALSGTRMVLTTQEVELRIRPREDANLSAVADTNILLVLGECNEAQWCRVTSTEGYKGWVRRRHLWGAQKL